MVLKESQVDKLWGVISVVLGILLYVLIIPSQIKAVPQSPWYNSPRFFPYLLAGILIVCGICLFLMGMGKEKKGNDPECCSFHLAELKIVLFTLLAIVAYTLAMSYLPLHYILVSALVMAFLMYLCGQRNWKLIVLVSILLPVIIFFSFKYGLHIRFP